MWKKYAFPFQFCFQMYFRADQSKSPLVSYEPRTAWTLHMLHCFGCHALRAFPFLKQEFTFHLRSFRTTSRTWWIATWKTIICATNASVVIYCIRSKLSTLRTLYMHHCLCCDARRTLPFLEQNFSWNCLSFFTTSWTWWVATVATVVFAFDPTSLSDYGVQWTLSTFWNSTSWILTIPTSQTAIPEILFSFLQKILDSGWRKVQ